MKKYDGSLNFDTKLDDSGFVTGLKSLGKIGTTALEGIGVAAGAAAAAVGKIGYDAIVSYSNYEQLKGGVETLFKDSANMVMENADKAFRTAGLSANAYMETVTSFSASLLQSVGGDTAEAAKKADMALVDMSDNANKMGTDMASIQNAYQGFAKQNYTMLDNLKLGYGGTKEEMQRLISDASKMKDVQEKLGVSVDASSMSFGNIVDAIHVVQDSLGILGTTDLEATTTIQGSLNMLKASWENLLTGIVDPSQDFDALVNNVFNSLSAFGEQLIPRLQVVLGGISDMVVQLAPKIIEEIPNILAQILPAAVDGIGQLMTAVSDTIVQIVPTLLESAGTLAPAAVQILLDLVNVIIQNLPLLLETGLQIITELAMGLTQALPTMIPQIVEVVLQIVDTLLDNIDMLIDVAIDLIMALADGLIQALPTLIEKIPDIVLKLVDAFVENAPKLHRAAGELIGKLVVGLIAAIPSLIKAVPKLISALDKAFKGAVSTVLSIGKNLVKGIYKGITGTKDWMLSKLKSWCKDVVDGIKGFFGIHSPSVVMKDEVGKYISLGIAAGITENTDAVKDSFQKMLDVLEYQRKFDIINEDAYYTELEKLRDKYFTAGSKEWLDYTEKIYSYQQNAVKKAYSDIQKYADDKLGEVIDKQEAYAKKLNSFGSLFKEVSVVSDDGEDKFYALADLDKQNAELVEYNDKLTALKQMLADMGISKNAADSFFADISGRSIEDGIKALDALQYADRAKLAEYLKSYDTRIQLTTRLSAEQYDSDMRAAMDESYAYMKSELEKAGFEVPSTFFDVGSASAKSFGDAFAAEIDEQMQSVQDKINEWNIKIKASIEGGGRVGSSTTTNTTNSNNTTTYNITTQKGEDTVDRLKREEKIKRMSGI